MLNNNQVQGNTWPIIIEPMTKLKKYEQRYLRLFDETEAEIARSENVSPMTVSKSIEYYRKQMKKPFPGLPKSWNECTTLERRQKMASLQSVMS